MMNKKGEKTIWKGVQLSYADHISNPSEVREDLYCLTLAQSEALIAVIDDWRYKTRWLDDDILFPFQWEAIRQFIDDTQRRLMMPCGSDNIIVLTQWTENGHFQESTDGGLTWHDAPNHDPRLNVALPPPFLPPDTTDEKCTYADAIVNKLINDWINHTGDIETQEAVIEGIIGFLAGIFGVFGVVAAVITLAMATIIVAFGVVAWKAAFVSAVWDRLRCNIFDNIGDDGTFSQADVDAIYDRIGTEETGIVAISLRGMIAAMGTQGLTIAARSGVGSPDADCDCSEECADNWQEIEGYGTITSIDGNVVTCQTELVAGTGWDISIKTPNPETCCILTGFDSTEPINTFFWLECGEVFGVDPAHSSIAAPIGHCVNLVSVVFAADTDVEFTFDVC